MTLNVLFYFFLKNDFWEMKALKSGWIFLRICNMSWHVVEQPPHVPLGTNYRKSKDWKECNSCQSPNHCQLLLCQMRPVRLQSVNFSCSDRTSCHLQQALCFTKPVATKDTPWSDVVVAVQLELQQSHEASFPLLFPVNANILWPLLKSDLRKLILCN